MKKVLFVLGLMMFNCNVALSANFTDTLGAECARILYNMEKYDYPSSFDTIKLRNSQIDALRKCVDMFIEFGGNIEEFNKRFQRAITKAEKVFDECYVTRDDNLYKDCSIQREIVFNNQVKINEDTYKK